MSETLVTKNIKGRRSVAHIKMTSVAYAPDYLVKCINKYGTKYQATLIGPNGSGSNGLETINNPDIPVIHTNGLLDFEGLKKIDLSKFHLVHYHNKFDEVFPGPKLIQYHSEPHYTSLNFPGTQTVISQFQALLPCYKSCRIVRNIIDLYSPPYNTPFYPNRIRIGFSPSITEARPGSQCDKGGPQTIAILKRLRERYPEIELDLIANVSVEECINRKNKCNVIIDECVTNSFHRSGLEGLALGKVTICSLSTEVADLMKKVSGSSDVPFFNVWIDQLEAGLEELICQGVTAINEIGKEKKDWFEKYWNPKTIVNEFEKLYDETIGG